MKSTDLPVRIFLSIICLAMIISIFIQDYSGYIPSTIFNRGKTLYYTLSIFSVSLLLGLVILLSFNRKKEIPVRLLLLFLSLFTVELALRAFDSFFVNRPEGILGNCYNVNGAYLFRPTPVNSLGLNESFEYSKDVPSSKTRIIFLGDSYTYGSGSSRRKSYCRMVQRYLNDGGETDFEIFNAGIPGYSPGNSYNLFRFLKNEGYQYDAVVISLLLQNDFTDDIKNTHTGVVAGIPQRFPDNRFIKYFHPLNSHLFRYLRVFKRMWERSRLAEPTRSNAQQDKYMINPILFERMETNYSKGASHDFENVYSSLAGIAEECGAPFYIVIFPDQFFGSNMIHDQMLENLGNPADYDFEIYYRWIDDQLKDRFDVFDLTGTIRSCPDCYLDNDTHLNDRGNRIAGKRVAEFLLRQNWED